MSLEQPPHSDDPGITADKLTGDPFQDARAETLGPPVASKPDATAGGQPDAPIVTASASVVGVFSAANNNEPFDPDVPTLGSLYTALDRAGVKGPKVGITTLEDYYKLTGRGGSKPPE